MTAESMRLEESRANLRVIDANRSFRNELSALINRHSRENGSGTPDFILAQYMAACLDGFDNAVRLREAWYGRGKPQPEGDPERLARFDEAAQRCPECEMFGEAHELNCPLRV